MDVSALRQVFSKYPTVHCVIHFAALKAVGESFQKVLEYYSNNIQGACNLLKVMEEFKYLPLDEKHRTGNCTNPYGTTKDTVERMMIDLSSANSEWCITLLRYFNPAGAHESGNIGEDPLGIPNNLMPYIAQVAIGRREKISVYGGDYKTSDGTGHRDYVHVVDLAEGHVLAVQHILADNRNGTHIFNLGSGTGSTVLEVIQAFSKACGKEIPYEIVGRRRGDVDSLYASCDRAQEELGWKSTRTLESMCRDMWNWQTKNPTGFNTTK
ncbi:UDP-glucose 4-epimerase [Eurytemora carolleeae]|uniref:UDP-glucose 4-epimerase n=1 Tax=Eurytemora carolleeae TaxID=1294199 RepID=UPI000C76EBD2|nr:UDP-glucose 4-epimerase [Eurytemora carolleeae]|eukprot:XP_023346863.1 UDP-glucose 4-epimerase-like [Eurytemora affinis]